MTDTTAEENPSFDFISDAKFRMALASDYRELLRCMDNGAWKAVHVLAGSVVEAMLTDYLIGSGYPKRSGKDPLRMELGPIISACKDEKIITDRTVDLSSVVRSYRNLIHPGRVIRLNESVDKKSATIARALVDIVAEEVAATKKSTYGFTAEQIANKISHDSSALVLLRHLLEDTNEYERERLVMEVIPERYFRQLATEDEPTVPDYSESYRRTLDTLSNKTKISVAKKYVKILKEESGDYVRQYEVAFFRASDMEHLDKDEKGLVKTHLLSRLEKDPSMLDVSEGFGPFLERYEIPTVVDVYVRTIASGKRGMAMKARQLLFMLYFDTETNVQAALQKRVDEWIGHWGEKGINGEAKSTLEELRVGWAEGIPF